MNQQLKFLSLAALINGTCFSMILPLLAPLTRKLQLTEFQGGVIVAAGAICMALASVWIARKQDQQSPQKLVNWGFWGMTATWAIFTLILYLGLNAIFPALIIFVLLVASRAFTGFFMALPQIGLQSYVMGTLTETHQRSQQMAMFGAMNSLGMIVGPFLTSIFLIGGLLLPMWIAVGALFLMSFVLSLRFKQRISNDDLSAESKNQIKPDIDDKAILKQSAVWLVLGFITYVAIVTLNMTAGFYIQDKYQLNSHQSALYFSQCMLIVGACLVFTQIMIVKVLKLSLTSLVVIGLTTMCLGLVLSIWAATILIFQTSYIFYGISVACLLPAFTTGAAQSVSQNAQVKMAGLCTSVQALGLIVGPLVSTWLYRYNFNLPFYCLIFLMLVIACYFVWSEIYKAKLAS